MRDRVCGRRTPWKKYDRMEDPEPGSLDLKIIRRLMLITVGDALAYANNSGPENSFYRTVHRELRKAIDELAAETLPVDFIAAVAHSLGCNVVFDCLCDVQDHERNGIGSILTPLDRYWTDNDLNKEIAARIFKVQTDRSGVPTSSTP